MGLVYAENKCKISDNFIDNLTITHNHQMFIINLMAGITMLTHMTKFFFFNPLWPSDAIWRQRGLGQHWLRQWLVA